MNVREVLIEIPKRFPTATLVRDDEPVSSWKWFRLTFPNKWSLSVGYGEGHYCDNRFSNTPVDHGLSKTMEIAIFKPTGEWYVQEGMDNITERKEEDGTTTVSGVIGWATSDRFFEVAEYIQLQ